MTEPAYYLEQPIEFALQRGNTKIKIEHLDSYGLPKRVYFSTRTLPCVMVALARIGKAYPLLDKNNEIDEHVALLVIAAHKNSTKSDENAIRWTILRCNDIASHWDGWTQRIDAASDDASAYREALDFLLSCILDSKKGDTLVFSKSERRVNSVDGTGGA